MKHQSMFRTTVSALSLAVAVLAVVGIARPAAADEQVPFKGRMDGVVTITPLAPPLVSVAIAGSGNATHLGQFTVSIPHTVNRLTRVGVGTYTFTAANGDQVFASFVGNALPTATPGILSILEVATITGGTGRFAGASGSFTGERLFDTIAGTTSGSFDGTISSPGSANP